MDILFSKEVIMGLAVVCLSLWGTFKVVRWADLKSDLNCGRRD